MLAVLPEVVEDECVNYKTKYGHRIDYGLKLLSHTSEVLRSYYSYLKKPLMGAIQLHERSRKILRCLLSWVRADVSQTFYLSLITRQSPSSFLFLTICRGCHTWYCMLDV